MFPIYDYASFMRRQEELLKEAEIQRLVRKAEGKNSGAFRLSRRGASWLGIHMVRWGQKLEQFGTAGNRQCAASISACSSSL